jgi:hypothetical protein
MNATPQGFDPITLNHWLWYKYRCHECAPSDFQKLFEEIVKRAKPEFMQIRPYGNIGDRKCDGLFYVEDQSTVFQVYSPDEFKQAELESKIHEDLDGAVKYWQSMISWTFVYNVRRGLPPDIPKVLECKRKQYPSLALDHWSSDHLWEMIRNLSLQQRCEILGAPAGYEYLFLGSSTQDLSEYVQTSWFVLVQDLMSPINLRDVTQALLPAHPFGAPIFVRPTYDSLPWTEAARQQKRVVNDTLQKSRDLLPRFAVFSLAPIPLAIHLGFVLSDRVEVECFQFDRDRRTWKWSSPRSRHSDKNIRVSGLPDEAITESAEVSIAISLSAKITRSDVFAAAPQTHVFIELYVDEPDVMWLDSPKLLTELRQSTRRVLSRIRSSIPRAERIHLFYAGPTGGAVVIGQQINPRMNPPVVLYQYSRQSSPAHQRALILTEDLS